MTVNNLSIHHHYKDFTSIHSVKMYRFINNGFWNWDLYLNPRNNLKRLSFYQYCLRRGVFVVLFSCVIICNHAPRVCLLFITRYGVDFLPLGTTTHVEPQDNLRSNLVQILQTLLTKGNITITTVIWHWAVLRRGKDRSYQTPRSLSPFIIHHSVSFRIHRFKINNHEVCSYYPCSCCFFG